MAQLQALATVANDAARAAGEIVARRRPQSVTHKAGAHSLASAVVTEVDRQSEAAIVERLTPTLRRHDLALLTEERPDDGSRHQHPYFWCIDPIDGTLPFVEGVPGYAVSIALVSRDGIPLIGVVVDPKARRLIRAVAGQGVQIDGEEWARPEGVATDVLSVYMDRSFATASDRSAIERDLGRVAKELGLAGPELHIGRAAVTNACAALMDPVACYFKLPKPQDGGGSLWDFAATACLFAEAGAHVSDIHGDPLDLNRADSTFMNHRGVLFATSERLAAQIVATYA